VTSVFAFSVLPLMPNAQAEAVRCGVMLNAREALKLCSGVPYRSVGRAVGLIRRPKRPWEF
jgi:hypothetical protein